MRERGAWWTIPGSCGDGGNRSRSRSAGRGNHQADGDPGAAIQGRRARRRRFCRCSAQTRPHRRRTGPGRQRHGPAARHRPAGGPLVAIVAHLDTVFPEGTDVTVKREGTRLTAPGVGDNTRSLAVHAGDDARDGRGGHPDGQRHPVCRRRRRRRARRPARREVSAATGQVQGSNQAVHRARWQRARRATSSWAASAASGIA